MTVERDVFEQLNRELAETKERLRKKQDLEQSLGRARESLRRERRRRWELEEALTKQGADVEMLERLSLRGLFLTVLGRRQEEVEKGLAALLAAELSYEECKEAITVLEREVAELEHQAEQLSSIEDRYRALLSRKKVVLLETEGKDATKVLELSEAYADARSDLHEVQGAINAGLGVVSSLDSAIDALKGARNWGTVDLLGGGLITTAVKHGRVDEARRWIHAAQQHLRRFRRELVNLGPAEGLDIEIGAFATFADYFFDGLIADWVVQQKINRSLDRTVEMRGSVRAAVNTLQRKRTQVAREVERIREEKEGLIEGA